MPQTNEAFEASISGEAGDVRGRGRLKSIVLALVALAMPVAAHAQATDYKLIIVANDSAVAIDYPDRERCQKAADAAEEEARRRVREAYGENADLVIKPALRVVAFCIPG